MKWEFSIVLTKGHSTQQREGKFAINKKLYIFFLCPYGESINLSLDKLMLRTSFIPIPMLLNIQEKTVQKSSLLF